MGSTGIQKSTITVLRTVWCSSPAAKLSDHGINNRIPVRRMQIGTNSCIIRPAARFTRDTGGRGFLGINSSLLKLDADKNRSGGNKQREYQQNYKDSSRIIFHCLWRRFLFACFSFPSITSSSKVLERYSFQTFFRSGCAALSQKCSPIIL